jgi:putative endonuclease
VSRSLSTHAQGQRGEDRAVEYLRDRGYSVIERNFRCRLGEIDIVARDGDTLVFVEVRTRTDGRCGTALETITPAKQRRIARVAEFYLTARRAHGAACRFDVIGITGEQVELVRDAFRLGW